VYYEPENFQDFLNMFFRDMYEPISSAYNLVLPMLWRHPENVELGEVKVVHYCASVRTKLTKGTFRDPHRN
jgi:lipopolysaccharide biosynthesis glycosyltransferase